MSDKGLRKRGEERGSLPSVPAQDKDTENLACVMSNGGFQISEDGKMVIILLRCPRITVRGDKAYGAVALVVQGRAPLLT